MRKWTPLCKALCLVGTLPLLLNCGADEGGGSGSVSGGKHSGGASAKGGTGSGGSASPHGGTFSTASGGASNGDAGRLFAGGSTSTTTGGSLNGDAGRLFAGGASSQAGRSAVSGGATGSGGTLGAGGLLGDLGGIIGSFAGFLGNAGVGGNPLSECQAVPTGDALCTKASLPHFYACVLPATPPPACELASGGNLTEIYCCP